MSRKIRLSDIKIKESFVKTQPKEEKIKVCRAYWNQYRKQDRDIVIDKNNFLVDGYIQYLVLKEQGVADVEVLMPNDIKHVNKRKSNSKKANYRNQLTTYIYGIHLNSCDKRQRVWRVPESWIGWENDLLPGDKILVSTRRGVAPIEITKIEWLQECPVDVPVLKVIRKLVDE